MRTSPLRISAGLLVALAVFVAPLHSGPPILPPPPAVPSSVPSAGSPPPPAAVPAEAIASVKPLFIAEYVSVYNAHGVYGFVPGSPVRLVRRESPGDWLMVTDGQFEVKVNSAQVTDDPVVAASLRQQAAVEDRAASATVAAQRLARDKARQQFLAGRRRYLALLYHLPPLDLRVIRLARPFDLNTSFSLNIFTRPYGLRGDPFDALHAEIPRGPRTHRPSDNPSDENSNYLGFY